jgi:hypothetical protein
MFYYKSTNLIEKKIPMLYRRCPALTPTAPNRRYSFDALHNPPEYRLSPCQAAIGMRAVHSVGRAATTHEFLLLLLILLILWSSSVGKLALSGFKVSATGFKVTATGFNPLRDVGLGRGKGTRYGPITYLMLPYATKQLRTYKLPFILKHNINELV